MTYDVEYDLTWHDMTWHDMTWHDTTRYDTLPQISLATLDADIVDSENAVQFKMGDALKLHGAQINIYTIWCIKYSNIFHEIGKISTEMFSNILSSWGTH